MDHDEAAFLQILAHREEEEMESDEERVHQAALVGALIYLGAEDARMRWSRRRT